MEQSSANCSTAAESCSTCSNRWRARLRRSALWVSLARGICHKHTTVYDMRQYAPDFRRNFSRRSNSKLSFAFGESFRHCSATSISLRWIACWKERLQPRVTENTRYDLGGEPSVHRPAPRLGSHILPASYPSCWPVTGVPAAADLSAAGRTAGRGRFSPPPLLPRCG